MTREKDAAEAARDKADAEHARSLDAARVEKAERDKEVGALRSSLEEVQGAVEEAKAETARAVLSAETDFELEMESARRRASDAETKAARHEAARVEAEACVARKDAARAESEFAAKASARAAEDAREEIERLTSTLAKETEKSSRFASEAVRAKSELAQARVEAGASSTAAAQSAWTDVVADLRARLEAAETVASRSAGGGDEDRESARRVGTSVA
jgi:colicin import membrane protein